MQLVCISYHAINVIYVERTKRQLVDWLSIVTCECEVKPYFASLRQLSENTRRAEGKEGGI